MPDYIALKWGTLKAWRVESEPAKAALQAYAKHGMSMSAMTQRDSDEQKQRLCDLIDAADCATIFLDWDGEDVPKDRAKRYVMDYDHV